MVRNDIITDENKRQEFDKESLMISATTMIKFIYG